MNLDWRRWNRAIHRDFGYLFFAMTVIYALSGIAVNHIKDWNPNYKVTVAQFKSDLAGVRGPIDEKMVRTFLKKIGEESSFKKFYLPRYDQLRIFIENGNITVDLRSGDAIMEKLTKRPLFHAVNYLHYNPGRWWTLFSDIFAGALILIAFTGLFILRGKNGITRRGALLTAIGIVIPVIYLIIFY